MKEAIILKGPDVKIVDTPVPKAEKGQVVVKVVYSGSNPKDWVWINIYNTNAKLADHVQYRKSHT